jgi:hypothetical protein
MGGSGAPTKINFGKYRRFLADDLTRRNVSDRQKQ